MSDMSYLQLLAMEQHLARTRGSQPYPPLFGGPITPVRRPVRRRRRPVRTTSRPPVLRLFHLRPRRA